jgi:putative DNA primase/helicase
MKQTATSIEFSDIAAEVQNAAHAVSNYASINGNKQKSTNGRAANTRPSIKRAHKDVLSEILDALKPINFRVEGELDATENLSQKHQIVLTVREVLRVAEELDCGLCRNADFLYAYNGEFWKLIEREQLETFLGQSAEKLGIDRITANYHKFRESLYKQFLAVAHLPKPEPPENKVLINLQNGTFEISTTGFLLRSFQREDFLTYQLPFAYDEAITCPKWQRFLDEVLPEINERDEIVDAGKSRQKVLAEYFGYIFTQLKLEKVLLMYGTGANGKSVNHDVLTALLGEENIAHYSLASLRHDYQRAMLSNKLINYASEISTRLESDIFKKLASGEPIEARLPYGRPFIMKHYARLAFNCNELPRDVEHNEAFFRRFLIIPFDITIAEENRNPNLAKEIIKSELSGVFNWLLAGLQRLLKHQNFTACEIAQQTLERYRKESDSVAMFVEEMSYQKVYERGQATMLKEIYSAYKVFCQDFGFRILNIQNLGNRLKILGFDCLKTNKGILVYAKKP